MAASMFTLEHFKSLHRPTIVGVFNKWSSDDVGRGIAIVNSYSKSIAVDRRIAADAALSASLRLVCDVSAITFAESELLPPPDGWPVFLLLLLLAVPVSDIDGQRRTSSGKEVKFFETGTGPISRHLGQGRYCV